MPQNNHTQAISMNGSAVKPETTPVSPEVTPKKARRNFSAAQKLKILSETDGLASGELGAYLRKAGLYHSNLSSWRQQRDEGLPAAIYHQLLDQSMYLCGISTMYRILHENGEVKERRRQRTRGGYTKPELLADGPNQVYSWDITKLRGPVKFQYYHLYGRTTEA